MAVKVIRASVRPRWPSAGADARTCRLGRRFSPDLASSLRRRRTFACVSASWSATARVAPNQSGEPGTTDRPVTTGPTDHTGRSGTSPEVFGPLQHTSAASRACSEGGRPSDVSRSGVSAARLPPARYTGPRSACVRPCGFSLLRQDPAASLDPTDVQASSSDPMFSRVACDARLHGIASTNLPSSSGPAARVGSVYPTRLIPHARGGPVGPSALSSAPPCLTARAGSCTDASFRAVFRYPSSRVITRPCRTRGPSLCRTRRSPRVTSAPVASSGGAPGVLVPFAGLIPHPGDRAAQVRRLNV